LNNLKVRCYSGHEYAERPESFVWEGAEYKVVKLEKEWLEPGERHFLVRSKDESLFELCYYEQRDKWSGFELVGRK
jgi:hypothetical protein